MKRLAIALLFLSAVCFAQTQPTNIYAAGVSFNSAYSPKVAGTGLYARSINDGSGTYLFTVVDAIPTSTSPFTVATNFGGGIAQKAFTVSKISVYIPTSAGVSYNGVNTGWAWSTGAMAPIKVSSKKSWYVFPNVRAIKSSVNNGSGYQVIAGVMFGWGQ